MRDLPHFTDEAKACSLAQGHAAGAVDWVRLSTPLHLRPSLVLEGRLTTHIHARAHTHTHTHTQGPWLHPSRLLCVFPVYTEFQPSIAEEKTAVLPEPWKLFQWVCPWENSSDLRGGKVGDGGGGKGLDLVLQLK